MKKYNSVFDSNIFIMLFSSPHRGRSNKLGRGLAGLNYKADKLMATTRKEQKSFEKRCRAKIPPKSKASRCTCANQQWLASQHDSFKLFWKFRITRIRYKRDKKSIFYIFGYFCILYFLTEKQYIWLCFRYTQLDDL